MQLKDARSTLEDASKTSEAHNQDLQQASKAFKEQQANIDRRLLIVTQSETSDDAVRKFYAPMASLHRLEVAQKYIGLLEKVNRLTSEARGNFKKSPQAALSPYLHLRNLVTALRSAQPAAEDAAPHLIDHIDHTSQTLWKQMKEAYAMDFEETLGRMQWPGKNLTLRAPLEQEWADGVKKLLDLQEPELLAKDINDSISPDQEEPIVLLPLEVMAKPLELRFRYHFDGDRPTNKLDKVRLVCISDC